LYLLVKNLFTYVGTGKIVAETSLCAGFCFVHLSLNASRDRKNETGAGCCASKTRDPADFSASTRLLWLLSINSHISRNSHRKAISETKHIKLTACDRAQTIKASPPNQTN
jgi:hypothetical protein